MNLYNGNGIMINVSVEDLIENFVFSKSFTYNNFICKIFYKSKHGCYVGYIDELNVSIYCNKSMKIFFKDSENIENSGNIEIINGEFLHFKNYKYIENELIKTINESDFNKNNRYNKHITAQKYNCKGQKCKIIYDFSKQIYYGYIEGIQGVCSQTDSFFKSVNELKLLV